jgi:hypothetical protein
MHDMDLVKSKAGLEHLYSASYRGRGSASS